MNDFQNEVQQRIAQNPTHTAMIEAANRFMIESTRPKYCYNFSWMDRPIIQYPQDIVQVQELIWQVRPDLIIETGIAHGGSLILSASVLALLEMCDAIQSGQPLDVHAPRRKVLGIDIEIRPHNREAIDRHPMRNRIEMIEGSSIAPDVVDQVRDIASRHSCILVFLDSNHTHDHVLQELQAYAPLTSVGSYCVVFDTIIEHFPQDMYADRPWQPGNSPASAITEYLETDSAFEIDAAIDNKLLITVNPGGFLKRVRE